ncbi:hypothetical protein D3C81_946600 [compost metagenome]
MQHMRLLQQRADRQGRARHAGRGGEGQVEAEHGQADGAERHQADLHLLARQAFAEQRADADAEGEHGEQQGHAALAAAEHVLGVGRELGEQQRAVQPEPGDAEDRQEHRMALAGEADVAPGFAQRVGVDLELRFRRRGGGNAQAAPVADHGDRQAGGGDPQAATCDAGEQAADQGADEDGDEGAGLDQRIAADQLVLVQVLRQDRVLHRAEQGRVQAEQEQAGEQQLQAVQGEAGAGDQHDGDLQQLDQPRQAGLVVLVGELPGGGGEQEERQDEDARRQVGQQADAEAGPLRGLEGQQHHQGVLEQVVVERAEELGGEERAEAAGLEQGELRTHVGLSWVVSAASLAVASARRLRLT